MTSPILQSEADFLAAPAEQLAPFAPKTIVVAPGGTRRAAVFAGVEPAGNAYARWSFEQMIQQFAMMFRLGVNHLFTGVITPNQWNEVGAYREHLIGWVRQGLAGKAALEVFQRLGWRVRLTGWRAIPELEEVAAKLEEQTPRDAPHTLWFWALPSHESVWEQILTTVRDSGARTREEVIRATYGEDLPLISLYLGFSKPEVSPVHLPPLLAGQVQCYWSVRPGYSLDELEFRRILHDYALLRPTWKADKTGRAQSALSHKDAWLNGPTIGLGMRLGEEFWYPVPGVPPR